MGIRHHLKTAATGSPTKPKMSAERSRAKCNISRHTLYKNHVAVILGLRSCLIQNLAAGLSKLVLLAFFVKLGMCLKKQRQGPWHLLGNLTLHNVGSFQKVQAETKLFETASRHFEWILNCLSFLLSNCLPLFLWSKEGSFPNSYGMRARQRTMCDWYLWAVNETQSF